MKYGDKVVIHRIPLMKEHKNPIQRAFRYFVQCAKYYFIGAFSDIGKKADLLLVSSTPPILGATIALIKNQEIFLSCMICRISSPIRLWVQVLPRKVGFFGK